MEMFVLRIIIQNKERKKERKIKRKKEEKSGVGSHTEEKRRWISDPGNTQQSLKLDLEKTFLVRIECIIFTMYKWLRSRKVL